MLDESRTQFKHGYQVILGKEEQVCMLSTHEAHVTEQGFLPTLTLGNRQ